MYDMGGLKVRQPLPSAELNYFDPFVLLHHADIVIDEQINLHHAGVGPHPHRGFSPVTFVFKGGSHHRDSRGNNKEVRAGGTQWMHAGMGMMHSERPVEHEMEIIQMWINSPAKNKMEQPFYYPLAKEETPTYMTDDKKTEVSIVTGDLFGVRGPIPTLTPINSAMIKMQAGGMIYIPFPATHHAFFYLLDGKVKAGEQEIAGKNMIAFKNDGDGIFIEALEDTRALFMSGEPIGEEIIAQGPFVMNSEIEIIEAYRDFKMGKMGVLIED